jgi:hypothetical protein
VLQAQQEASVEVENVNVAQPVTMIFILRTRRTMGEGHNNVAAYVLNAKRHVFLLRRFAATKFWLVSNWGAVPSYFPVSEYQRTRSISVNMRKPWTSGLIRVPPLCPKGRELFSL